MGFELTLTKKLNSKHYSAIGTAKAVKNGQEQTGAADVLVEVVDKDKVKLVVDSSIKKSTVFGKEVLAWTNATPVQVEVKVGNKFRAEKIFFNLKRN